MRVISGKYRGKKLSSADKSITRPTADRAKEGLFNILNCFLFEEEKEWEDVLFADVFAGSGAIGIEAASRGAKHVFFFENNQKARRHLERNIQEMDACFAVFSNALFPPPAAQSVDIYFSDAPYGQNLTEPALYSFCQNGWIDNSTLIILETDSKEKLNLSDQFRILRQVSYGRNNFLFVEWCGILE